LSANAGIAVTVISAMSLSIIFQFESASVEVTEDFTKRIPLTG
jgi:hypothetical protein